MSIRHQQPLLQLRFEGPAVAEGRILLADLLQFISNFDLALERLINVMEHGSSIRVGRPSKAAQALSALEVVALEPGDFGLGLNLRRKEPLIPGLDTGKQALQKLVDGLASIGSNAPLPPGFDRGVLVPLREAGRVFDRGIEAVHITTSSEIGGNSFIFNKSTRDRIVSRFNRPPQAWAVAEGRLLMADLKEEQLRCRLHPSTGDPILCTFDEELANTVMKYLRRFVRVRGEAKVDHLSSKIQSIVIKDIEPIEELTDSSTTTVSTQAFWNPKSFDELSAEQGVYPVEDWDKLSGQWPEDADFDEFLAAVRSARREQ